MSFGGRAPGIRWGATSFHRPLVWIEDRDKEGVKGMKTEEWKRMEK